MELPHRTCPYCGHTWVPRKEKSERCPKCHKTLEPKKKGVVAVQPSSIPALNPSLPYHNANEVIPHV